MAFIATPGRAQPAPWTPGDTVRAAVLEHWPPHYSVQSDGTPTGFAVDVMEAVAVRVDLDVRFVRFPSFPEAIAALESGDVDVIPDFGIVPSRTGAYAFTRPFNAFRISVFVRESSPDPESADLLDGRRVAVVRSNVAVELLRERHPEADLVVFDDVREALFELMAAGVDAAAYPEEVFLALARSVDMQDHIRILPDPLTEVPRGMGVRSTDSVLRARLDQGVEGLVGSAAYEQIYQRWFRPPESFWTVERLLWGGGGLLLLILLGMGLWRYRSVSRLAERLQESLEERRAAEAARREEEVRFQTLVEAAYEGVALVDTENRIVLVNRRACEIVGLDEEEILGESIFRFVAEEHEGRVRAGVERRRSGRPDSYELLIRRSDGRRIWVLLSVAPIQGNSSEFRGSVAMLTEITEQKEAERALEETARQLRKTLASLEAAVLLIDPGQRCVVECNEAAEEMFGYSRRQLLGRDTRSLHVDQEHYLEFGRRSKEVLDDGRSFSSEFVMRRADGTTFPTRHTVTLLDAEEGLAGGVVSVVRDVTEQRMAEAEQRDSEERFRQIAEHIDDIFWVRTPDSRQVLYLSPAYEAITGRPREEVYEDPSAWLEAIHPDDRERVMARRPDGEGVPFEEEYRIVRADGEVRWIWDRAFPIRNEQGEVYRIVGVAEDITEREELERKLRQSQKLEAVGRLAGGVAHDFNNLLTVIRVNTEFLLEEYGPSDPDGDHVEEIRQAAIRGSDLTRQLLAFSRDQVLEPRAIQLNDVVATMNRLLQRVIGEDVELGTELEDELPAVEIDPGQFEQVIMNLAVNAREAMPDGGKLEITTRSVELSEEDRKRLELSSEGPHVCLAFRDTGRGMDEETREQIFEPFFTTKPQELGTGLGLATVHGVVRQSGGAIEVESEPGSGATFRLYFPSTEKAVEEDLEAEPSVGSGSVEGSGHLLLVEDDGSVRRVLRHTLVRYGYEVTDVPSVDDAKHVLADTSVPVDLILTDLVLPGASGLDLIEHVRDSHPDVKLIVMSGYSRHEVLEERVLEKGIRFLAKPFTPEEVGGIVRDVLKSIREDAQS